VRALRERAEDAAKEAVAGALRARMDSERQLDAASERVALARDAQLDAASIPVGAMDLIARQAYLERTERSQRASEEDLTCRQLALDERREELIEAARDHRALERLKEHRRSDHDRELARREGIELDEIAINAFRRRALA